MTSIEICPFSVAGLDPGPGPGAGAYPSSSSSSASSSCRRTNCASILWIGSNWNRHRILSHPVATNVLITRSITASSTSPSLRELLRETHPAYHLLPLLPSTGTPISSAVLCCSALVISCATLHCTGATRIPHSVQHSPNKHEPSSCLAAFDRSLDGTQWTSSPAYITKEALHWMKVIHSYAHISLEPHARLSRL